jgi:hypothetical protein
MLLRSWRLAAILIASLSMGTTLAHLLEMPAKLHYGGALWLTLLQTLYPPAFGTIGAFFEAAAIGMAGALAISVRRRTRAFVWTVAGASCLLAAHAAFWIWVAPVNRALLPLTPETLPPDWTELRDQWEYAHAARALLQITGLGALVLSVLVETPTRGSER